ncbi:MAG: Hsp20/alpha crystallin family protein [Deltaproteobacteria bacterium]|jgi:HSP20 family protein|nr:Hsp20/alpha crystallin family protein [Deltaproteobacteria bacterium]MCL5880061.1 Hsp20/alpha crystallin family protein [Deltaproteobacteria bacterium]MDA8304504.1 Hsp20/alpha crystallin family protein [Deltaproteobacteria bacterium]
MANVSVWDPVSNIRSDFEKLFSDFFPTSVKRIWGYEPGLIEPAVDVVEKEDTMIVRAELPGISKDEVKIEVHENRLILKGKHKTEKEEKKEDYYRKEIECGSFYRSIELPSNAEASSAKASLKDGILEITLKKAAEAKPIAIEVK